MTWVVEEFLRTKESWHPGERGLRTLLSSVLHLPKPKAKDPIPVAPRRALSFQPSQGVLAAHFHSRGICSLHVGVWTLQTVFSLTLVDGLENQTGSQEGGVGAGNSQVATSV